MPLSTFISFVVIYAQTCKHVYNFRILESKIPHKTKLFSFDQPHNCSFACIGITELTVVGAFKSEVMLESDIGHSLPEDTSMVSGAVTTTLIRV